MTEEKFKKAEEIKNQLDNAKIYLEELNGVYDGTLKTPFFVDRNAQYIVELMGVDNVRKKLEQEIIILEKLFESF
jgi:hypothetical protein